MQLLREVAMQAHWGMAVSILVFITLFALSVKKPEIVADDGSFSSRMTATLAIASVLVFAVSFWATVFAWLPAVIRWLSG